MPEIIEIEGKYFEGTLPAGKINKKYTGIGATTSEIFNSGRHSVIVLPTRALAATKVLSNRVDAKSKNILLFYIGSKYEYLLPDDLEEVKQAMQSGYIIKIIAVADSFVRHFKSDQDFFLDNFHLLIDEVDVFQFDSSFRKPLYFCIDIYKLFPPSQRTMISATLQGFSDGFLKGEPLSTFKKKRAKPLDIIACQSKGDFEVNLAELIVHAMRKSKPKKLIVAYNYVKGIIKTIAALDDTYKVAVLSSEFSKSRFPVSWDRQLAGGIVDADVVFMTSAYFSGVDINMKADVIVACNAQHEFTRLTEARIIQVIGRVRDYKSTNYFLFNTKPGLSVNTRDYAAKTASAIRNIASSSKNIQAELAKDHFIQNGQQNTEVLKLIQNFLPQEHRDYIRICFNGELEANHLLLDNLVSQKRADNLFYSQPNATSNNLIKSGNLRVKKQLKFTKHIIDFKDFEQKLSEIHLNLLDEQKDMYLFNLQRAFTEVYGWTNREIDEEGARLIRKLYELAVFLNSANDVNRLAQKAIANSKKDIAADLRGLESDLRFLLYAKHPEVDEQLKYIEEKARGNGGLVPEMELMRSMKKVHSILNPESGLRAEKDELMKLCRKFFSIRKNRNTDLYKIKHRITIGKLKA